MNLTPPSRTTGSTDDKLNGLYSYLYQLVEALNVSLGQVTTVQGSSIEGAIKGTAAGSGGSIDVNSSAYQQLKALIVKTATEVTGGIRRTVTEIAHEYMAQSEFGTYEEYLNHKISQGADGVLMEWDAENNITTPAGDFDEYTAQSNVSMKIGIVKYNDDGTVEAGMVIGKELQKVTIDGRELITSQNVYALFTAEELSFWQDGVCRARYGMVEFMVNKGYIDEITTSLITSETFGAQLVLKEDVLSAIAANIDLAANESIKLVVESTAAKELRTGTTVTITDEMFHVSSPETRFSIPAAYSEDAGEIVSIDEEGLRSTVITADEVHSPSVVNTALGAAHVPATAGEMQVILDELSGKYLVSDVTIDAAAITAGAFTVTGLHGNGRLVISGGTMNTLTVTSSDALIELDGVSFSITGTALTVSGGQVLAKDCIFNAGTAVSAAERSRVEMRNCSGVCSTVGDVSSMAMIRVTGGGMPYGLMGAIDGGEFMTPYIFTEYEEPEEPPEAGEIQTATLTAINTRSWGSGWISKTTYGNALYQGRYGDNTLRRGCMWFDTTYIAGKTIISATLTLKRYSGVGQGGAVQANIYGTDITTDSGTPAIGDKFVTFAISPGATKSIDVTTAVQALADGTIKGLMIYDSRNTTFSGKEYTYGYSKFYGIDTGSPPVLSVTYQ